LPFLVASHADPPAIDPISGVRGDLPVTEAPQRIGIIGEPFLAAGESAPTPAVIEAVTTALFALGHTVHVLTAAERRTILFQNGAYIHAELLPHGVEPLAAGVRRLVQNDGIQLLVGLPVDLQAAWPTAAQSAAPQAEPNLAAVHAAASLVGHATAQGMARTTGQIPAGAATPDVAARPDGGGEALLPPRLRSALAPLLTAGYQVQVVQG
jgi:hypothetical protein